MIFVISLLLCTVCGIISAASLIIAAASPSPGKPAIACLGFAIVGFLCWHAAFP